MIHLIHFAISLISHKLRSSQVHNRRRRHRHHQNSEDECLFAFDQFCALFSSFTETCSLVSWENVGCRAQIYQEHQPDNCFKG